MSFVCERLNEEDKEYIQSFQFQDPFGRRGELNRIPRYWAVDRERKYYLICLGGQGYTLSEEYPPYYYRLIIDNIAINIEARFKSEGDGTKGVTMMWQINSIAVPNFLEYISREELISIVKEAFTTYSNNHKGDNILAITFANVAVPHYYVGGGK